MLAEVRAAAKDWQRFSSRVQGDPDVRDYPQLPLEVDPPEHGAYRALVEPILGRRAVVAFEDDIRSIARRDVERFRSRGSVEAVRGLAIPMVASTIALVLGRPGDADELASWGITSWEVRPDGTRSGARLDAYVARALDEGAVEGGDGAFARLARATVDGRPLTRREQVGLANLLLAGGRDTVILTICGALWHLAGEPAARRDLRAHPDRLPLAIEEYLRYFSPNPGMERRLTADAAGEWGSARAGEIVVLGWGPANHDPAAFETPGEIRLDRRPNPHLAFGSGVHTCVGIHLARLEVRVFLDELLAAVPDWHLAGDPEMEWLRLGHDLVPARFDSLPLQAS
ncbi:MAG TPA: cytochrome P450 [Candidatus Binatia bacterium]|nr:cytochrome P450 [Candidatus Binatia bacterium]